MYSIERGEGLTDAEFFTYEKLLHDTVNALPRFAKRVLSERSPSFIIVPEIPGRGGFWSGNSMTMPLKIPDKSTLPRFLNNFFSDFATRSVHELAHGLLQYKSGNRLPENFRLICEIIKAEFTKLAPFECLEISQTLTDPNKQQDIPVLSYLDRPPQMQLGIIAYTLMAREYYTAFGYGQWGPLSSEFRIDEEMACNILVLSFRYGEELASHTDLLGKLNHVIFDSNEKWREL